MENRTVRFGLGWLHGLLGFVLAALLVSGCRSTHDSEYVNIPDLPGTPLGIPGSSTPVAAASESGAPASSSAVSSSSPVVASNDTGPETTKVTQRHAPAAAEAKSDDTINAGEMLHIVFSDTPQALVPVDDTVKEDGTITLMYNETFHAAGKTPGDLAQEIRKRYVPDFFRQLTASVLRVTIRRRYFVDGEVRTPSQQEYIGHVTVTQAIASAGGFTDFAAKTRVKLIRTNGKTETVNCKKALEHPELDPEVHPGDKVHVPRSYF